MFCKKCGTEIKDGDRFCPKCGYDTQSGAMPKQENKIIEDGEIKYQLRPEFHLGYKIITTFGRAILYTLFYFLLFVGDFEDFEDGEIVRIMFAIIIGIAMIYMIIKLIFEKIQYKHFEYNFYNTKVEYIDGFLNKEEKELKYKHIREVALKQNILERAFGIGTIRIYTNASSGLKWGGYGNYQNARNMNGLQIHCIRNPKEQYEKVKALIDAISEDE